MKSLNRPYISNDNPYSEASFKTMKYHSMYPKLFGGYHDAIEFCRMFFEWYNNDHKHSGIAWMTPFEVHYGLSHEVYKKRQKTLVDAYQEDSGRFKGKVPRPPELPGAVWINKPEFPNLDKNMGGMIANS